MESVSVSCKVNYACSYVCHWKTRKRITASKVCNSRPMKYSREITQVLKLTVDLRLSTFPFLEKFTAYQEEVIERQRQPCSFCQQCCELCE